MATATKKDRPSGKTRRGERSASRATMEFFTSQDNSNAYYWELVAGDGASLARSGSFSSRATAEQAVQ
ncbi:MAG: DUF1508 domain-containing protein, partial [Solirubrobacteraceae bacterium]